MRRRGRWCRGRQRPARARAPTSCHGLLLVGRAAAARPGIALPDIGPTRGPVPQPGLRGDTSRRASPSPGSRLRPTRASGRIRAAGSLARATSRPRARLWGCWRLRRPQLRRDQHPGVQIHRQARDCGPQEGPALADMGAASPAGPPPSAGPGGKARSAARDFAAAPAASQAAPAPKPAASGSPSGRGCPGFGSYRLVAPCRSAARAEPQAAPGPGPGRGGAT